MSIILSIIGFFSFSSIGIIDKSIELNKHYTYVEESKHHKVIYGLENIAPNVISYSSIKNEIVIQQIVNSRNDYISFLADTIYVENIEESREDSFRNAEVEVSLEPHKTIIKNNLNYWVLNTETSKLIGPFSKEHFCSNKFNDINYKNCN